MSYVWVCKITQKVDNNDSSCSRPYDLNLVPETHMMEETTAPMGLYNLNTDAPASPKETYAQKTLYAS